jgi:hypothetical protein
VKDEIQHTINLAQAFQQHKYYGESYQSLQQAKTSIEMLSLSAFDPQGKRLNVFVFLFLTHTHVV